MRINQNPGRTSPDRMATSIHNADTVAIPLGAPVVLAMNGTNDGLDVVLPSTSAAQKIQGLRYGVCTKTIQVGEFAEAIVFGFTNSLLLYRQTRADSTQVWASEAARSVGEYLTISSAINGFVTAVSTQKIVTNATTDTLALQIYNPDAVLGQTLASYSSSASSTADTRTAITALVKAFVRLM